MSRHMFKGQPQPTSDLYIDQAYINQAVFQLSVPLKIREKV